MAVSVIWLNQEHARIFRFSEEIMERKIVRPKFQPQSSRTDETGQDAGGPADEIDRRAAEFRLFEEVVEQLRTSGGLVVSGRDGVQDRFCQFLKESYPDLAKKVVGCERLDQPGDLQIAAMATQYFWSGGAAAGAR